MAKHEFGGLWTEDKLERIRKYLSAYTTIFRANTSAQALRTCYVDAFAGTGDRTPHEDSRHDTLFTKARDDARSLCKGSARIALEVEPSFDRYLLIDSQASHVGDLEAVADEFPGKRDRVEIVWADANQHLLEWCSRTNWRHNRAVVFLDPYGMQVEWSTIEAIAKTKAIDLWVLFPLGVAVNRLLTRNEPPPKHWSDAVTKTFGTDEWIDRFYPEETQQTLFGPEVTQRKAGRIDEIGEFFIERLRMVFEGVATPRAMLNSTKTPIYLLCFAAGNKKGARTAVRIAQDILLKD